MTRKHHLAEEDYCFETSSPLKDEGFDIEADHDDIEINEFADPMVYLMALQEAAARATEMRARNEKTFAYISNI